MDYEHELYELRYLCIDVQPLFLVMQRQWCHIKYHSYLKRVLKIVEFQSA